MSSHILLRNATMLVPFHESNDYVVPLWGHSLLITHNKIAQIGQDFTPPTGAEIIDCNDKFISPGFIDTHHHLWQTQLKGRHANQTLSEYMPNGPIGYMQNSNYEPEVVFWGELGGCLEALDGGTTTVVDHAHVNVSAAHTSNAVEATASSGIRSVFCYAPTMRVKTFKPDLALEGGLLDEWVIDSLRYLGANAPFGDGRIHLGLAFDGFMLSKGRVVSLYAEARRLGVKLITTHYVKGLFNDDSVVDILDSCGALGIDCHSNDSGDIVSQMRLALQHERASRNEQLTSKGKTTLSLNLFVQDVFRLSTRQGSRAIQMDDKLGSLEVGKPADLVIFESNSPGMVCASEEAPVAAIVLHSSVRDIDTVIVDGHVRKRNGKLCTVQIDPSMKGVKIPRQSVEWNEVARQLTSSRGRIQDAIAKVGAIEPERLTKAFTKLAHING
ncbi:uncharacterized protein N7477_007055, partial [Penicillium maclennaniae]|uniref:uncharacterized protein n=1 Tax=Penicillium maclennaniae TaxID=1343394 RepID=UPI0025400664